MADEVVLEKGWELCCKADDCCKGLQGPNEADQVWCDDFSDCYKHDDCGCHVFYRFKQKDAVWYHEPKNGPGNAVDQRDKAKWEQRCFCAKQTKKDKLETRLLRDVGQLLIDLSSEQAEASIAPKLTQLPHGKREGKTT